MSGQLVDAFGDLDVLVVGDAPLDVYLDGTADRLCREGPVPAVRIESRLDLPGGAANTALNARALGARVDLLSVLGDDDEGGALVRALEEAGVGTRQVQRRPERRTLTLTRVSSDSQLLVRYDRGTTSAVDDEVERSVVERLDRTFPSADAVIVSDYGHGLVTPAVVAALARLQARQPRVVVVDSKRPAAFRQVGATAIKPNWDEAVQLLLDEELEADEERADAIARHGARLVELTGAAIVAVTLDREGAIVFERGRPPHRTYAQPTSPRAATGAGDTFVATLALVLAAGAHTPAAAELASAAAAVVVGKQRTAVCSADELRERLVAEDKFVSGLDRLVERVEAHRRQGRRIVFTNGCFDILHRGHISYLNRAKALGDVLVAGVNDDDSVRRLKGPGRPVNPLEDRIRVLGALSCVDHIVAFSGETPAQIIGSLRPEVYAKGGDYTRESLPEAPLVEELGGQVKILPFVEDLSTSGIIERIRAAARVAT